MRMYSMISHIPLYCFAIAMTIAIARKFPFLRTSLPSSYDKLLQDALMTTASDPVVLGADSDA